MVKGEFLGADSLPGRGRKQDSRFRQNDRTLYATLPRNDGMGFHAAQGRECQGGVPWGLTGESVRRWWGRGSFCGVGIE